MTRLEELSNSNHEVSVVRRVGERCFYFKTAPGENDRKLYVRRKVTGAERLLVDPDKIAADGKRYSITAYSVSPDARHVSYIASAGGAETGELRVVEVASGRDLGERIDRARWSAGNWLPDGRSFVYWRQRKLDPEMPATEAFQKSRTYLHVLGADPEQDKPLHGYGVNPALDVDPVLFPWVWVPYGSKYALAVLDTGVSPNYALFVAPLASLGQPAIPWKRIADFSDQIKSIVIRGDDLFLLSYKNAPHFRVLRTSAKNPDLAHAREVVPPGTAVIDRIAGARDALYVQLLDGGIARLLRVDYENYSRREIKLPYQGNIFELYATQQQAGALVAMDSWVKPPAYFVFDPGTSRLVATSLQPPSRLDVAQFESVEVAARSHDGTMVPLSIVHRRGLKLDGTESHAADRIRRIRVSAASGIQSAQRGVAGTRRSPGIRARAWRRRVRARVAHRRTETHEAEHVERLHRLCRIPDRRKIHELATSRRTRPQRGRHPDRQHHRRAPRSPRGCDSAGGS